jgi:hypothetical protein
MLAEHEVEPLIQGTSVQQSTKNPSINSWRDSAIWRMREVID